MAVSTFINIFCDDRLGMVSDITGVVAEMGGNFSDMTADLLGQSLMFNALTVWPDEPPQNELETRLHAVDGLATADIYTKRYTQLPFATDRVTNRMIFRCNKDNPGDISALCEPFTNFDANLLRVHARRLMTATGSGYEVTVEAAIPKDTEAACKTSVEGTAARLGYESEWS